MFLAVVATTTVLCVLASDVGSFASQSDRLSAVISDDISSVDISSDDIPSVDISSDDIPSDDVSLTSVDTSWTSVDISLVDKEEEAPSDGMLMLSRSEKTDNGMSRPSSMYLTLQSETVDRPVYAIMSRLRNIWACMRGRHPEEDNKYTAAQTTETARMKFEAVSAELQADIDLLGKKLDIAQVSLRRQVDNNAHGASISKLMRQIKDIKTSMSSKQRLYDTVDRETSHLQDMSTNTSIAAAMTCSLDAQKTMTRVDVAGADALDIDEIIDDIEDHRADTATLTSRLGKIGRDYSNEESDDDDDDMFSADDVAAAMGMYKTSPADMLPDDAADRTNLCDWRSVPDGVHPRGRMPTVPTSRDTRVRPFFGDLHH